MARTSKELEIKFPLSGNQRRGEYPQKIGPYTTPYSLNCRGVDSYERRLRGGSRPPIEKWIDTDLGGAIRGIERVSYIDSDGDHQTDLAVLVDNYLKVVQGSSVTTIVAEVETEAGVDIMTEAGDDLLISSTYSTVVGIGSARVFGMVEHEGKIYIAGDTLEVYDPRLGTVSPVDNAPSDQRLIESYLGRIVLSGEDHNFYMSRMGKPDDWGFGDDGNDVGRAVSGVTGDQSRIGGDITCLKAWEDKILMIATKDDLWAYYGDPNAGQKVNVSHEVGIVSKDAVTITEDGLVVFLSRKGVYQWQVGSKSAPKPFSEEVEPEELRDIDDSDYIISMEYCKGDDGVYLNITPKSDLAVHYKCEENADNTDIVDSTGNGFDAEASVNTSTLNDTGHIGDGLHFNGAGEEVEMPENDIFSLYKNGGEFTIAAWIYHDATAGADAICGNHSALTGWYFGVNNLKQLFFIGRYNTDVMDSRSTATIPDATWTHVAVRVSSDYAHLYINGSEVSSYETYDQGTGGVIDDSELVMYFGSNGGSYYWDGIIDDFRFYTDSISDASIAAVYNGGTGTEGLEYLTSETGEHWFLEFRTRAFWRDGYGNNDHQPLCTATLPISGDSPVINGCIDGYLRRHVHSGTNDDGTAMTSHILLGPLHLGNKRSREGMLKQIFGDLASGSGDVTWRTVAAKTPEECIDNAVSDIEGGTTTYVHSSGTLSANHNRFKYPRTRGAWCVIWLTATARWAYDKLGIVVDTLGRIR